MYVLYIAQRQQQLGGYIIQLPVFVIVADQSKHWSVTEFVMATAATTPHAPAIDKCKH